MKLPDKINVGHYDLRIRYSKNIKGDKGEDLWGFADLEKLQIILQKGMAKNRECEVFLHELLHIIDKIYGLRLDEQHINLLAFALIDVIFRNKIDFLK